ncbi:DHHC zinc finger protein (macronuclear) [Tetrahymena thermophila SB210]|uniref:DHHC zinc finger protein n=1 Tax=Tetrahymena thermophila (strain SB210) TaxID=312017 RepID=I7MH41_TETTS|nr:DHHC zinc finger protein [Tetrahymena thermophila SB210]EAS02605.2 DHHC zinc finger protein [Tetrahymena thermophila SB210]|eukprot:XP_001022850.2 DHHC zinc finger protein [Tetrahymena thermophila SB210]
MFRRAFAFTSLFIQGQRSVVHLKNKQKSLVFQSQAQFGFFSNIFASKEQKQINELYQQLQQAADSQKANIMNQVIQFKQKKNQKQDYENYQFDQFVLAEYYMKQGKTQECNAIFKNFERLTKLVSQEEIMARKLSLFRTNTQLQNELEKALKKPTDQVTHSLPYGQYVLGTIFFDQKNYQKSEEILIKARDNVDILLEIKDKDQYAEGNKLYVKLLSCLKLVQLYFKQKNFDLVDQNIAILDKTWETLEDNHEYALGYQISKASPLYIEIADTKAKIAEFFQNYVQATDIYQSVIVSLEPINEVNSLQLIQLKLRQLDSLIFEKEYYDSKLLMKQLKEYIEQYHPNNPLLQAELQYQEIHFLYKKKKFNEINDKINQASQFCLQNKIMNLTYARILYTYIRLNIDKSENECGQVIQNVDKLLKGLEDVPASLIIDFYLSAAQFYSKQKDINKLSQYMRQSIDLLKSPPQQILSALRSYLIWAGYYLELGFIEEAKKIHSEAKDYKAQLKFDGSFDELKAQYVLLEIEQTIKIFEHNNNIKQQ